MDIKNTDNKCNLKCAFNYNYSETTIQSIINPAKISLKFGTPSIAPVKFNGVEYTPIGATIQYPSSTTYNGVQADGELIILHSANMEKNLIVSIPINTSSVSKPPVLDDIINQTATLLPKTAYTNLTIPSFSVGAFIPKGTFFFADLDKGYTIYYGLDNTLFMSTETMDKLKQIVINPAPSGTVISSELFYNSDGSNLPSEGGADFNFLECDQVYEETVAVDEKNSGPTVIQTLLMNPTFVLALEIVVAVICILGVLYFAVQYIKNNT
jgi:hypothetical protein